MPFMALYQKSISALTSGDVPDLIFSDAPTVILPVNAWNDRLVDLTDVVETQKDEFSRDRAIVRQLLQRHNEEARLLSGSGEAGECPDPHLGRPGREGRLQDVRCSTKQWDDTWNFFKPVQKELRAKGMRKMYTIGLQITTVGPNDGNNLFYHFLIANGGLDIITKDGKLHTDDPQVREAAIRRSSS